MFSLLWVAAALAQDAVSLNIVAAAQRGQGVPQLVVHANTDLKKLAVSLRCAGQPFGTDGPAKSGQDVTVDIALSSAGTAACSGELSIALADGSEGAMPLQFDVSLLDPIEITAVREALDLEAGRLAVTLSRPAAQVSVIAYGLDGELGDGSTPAGGLPAGAPIAVEWSQPDGAEVLQLAVKAEDEHGFWSGLELFPWYYDIPHEDVVFETNAATVRDSEAPKLSAAMDEITSVQEKYGKYAQINLYVAGYTDSVGGKSANQALSERRAKAIAAWFRAAGFSGTVYYQGFGEDGLLVQTGDEVDEPRNRRAAYIIAAEAPPESPQLPGSRWRAL